MAKTNVLRRIARRLRRSIDRRPKPAILMYHRIARESFDPWGLAVTEARFSEQVHWLKVRRKLLPMTKFAELHAEDRLPRNAIAITFDDGFACNALKAAPLLNRSGVPATMYICTDPIEQTREFWWDELEHLVLTAESAEITLEVADSQKHFLLGPKQSDDRDWPPFEPARTARQRAYHEIWSTLRLRSNAHQQDALRQLRELSGKSGEPRPTHRPMTREEVRKLPSAGIELGAHSLTHPSLPSRTEEEKIREIAGSRDKCMEIAGVTPTSFAYPFGDCDEGIAGLVAETGFRSACTTDRRWVDPGADAYRLPRLQVLDWSANELAKALAQL